MVFFLPVRVLSAACAKKTEQLKVTLITRFRRAFPLTSCHKFTGSEK